MWPIEFRSNNLSDTVCGQNYQKRRYNLNSISISMKCKHSIWYTSEGKTESDKLLKTERLKMRLSFSSSNPR